MKIVYIILVYQLPEQIIRLIKKLDTPDVSFVIHIDRNMKK